MYKNFLSSLKHYLVFVLKPTAQPSLTSNR